MQVSGSMKTSGERREIVVGWRRPPVRTFAGPDAQSDSGRAQASPVELRFSSSNG